MMCMMSFVFMPHNATRSVSGGVMITMVSRNSTGNAKWLRAICQLEEGTERASSIFPVQNLSQDVMSVEMLHKA